MASASAARRAIPMISYQDVAAAVDWLSGAFGFEERGASRHADADGTVTHAELALDGAMVMLGYPGPAYESPRRHAETCARARAWLDVPWVVDGVLVEVTDVDGHHDRAVAYGAPILRPPEAQPFGRLYTAADHEGHRWMFISPAA